MEIFEHINSSAIDDVLMYALNQIQLSVFFHEGFYSVLALNVFSEGLTEGGTYVAAELFGVVFVETNAFKSSSSPVIRLRLH